MTLRQRNIFAVTAFVLIAGSIALLYVTRRSWLWQPLNPRYSAAEIVGLNRTEVIERLGPPSYDNRAHDPEGPDTFGYFAAAGMGIAIDFDEAGKAIRVRDASK